MAELEQLDNPVHNCIKKHHGQIFNCSATNGTERHLMMFLCRVPRKEQCKTEHLNSGKFGGDRGDS